jgi:hypothetical protein
MLTAGAVTDADAEAGLRDLLARISAPMSLRDQRRHPSERERLP